MELFEKLKKRIETVQKKWFGLVQRDVKNQEAELVLVESEISKAGSSLTPEQVEELKKLISVQRTRIASEQAAEKVAEKSV